MVILLREVFLKAVGVIPARYDSVRFPGKPLAKICGKTMIEWVYKRVAQCKNLSSVFVATDDDRIFKEVQSFGGKCIMTPKECISGTDRVARASENICSDIVVNIQGDEPLIAPYSVDILVNLFKKNCDLSMGTLITPIKNKYELYDSNTVKVVVDKDFFCIYFSRSPIPYLREDKFDNFTFFKHIGIYAYKKDFLLKFSSMKQSKLEKAEKLEQLRALENGFKIKSEIIPHWIGLSVDTPNDIVKVEEEIKKGGISPP